ncbi:MAG TPA: NifU family protein [Bryobacteraceae bacterium]|jgi:Fe-S cluster biogenesis protein NfuA
MTAQAEFQERLQSIETLLSAVESAADPNVRASVQELMRLVMDLHGAGLERTLELIHSCGDEGGRMIDKLGRDELVSSLLILYGLHPAALEERVVQALDKVRPRLRSHDGEVELLNIVEDGSVRLRIEAKGHGCGSTAQALKQLVEESVYQFAPDVTTLVIEGADENPSAFVPLEMLQGLTAVGK